jgi:hypothetical protein
MSTAITTSTPLSTTTSPMTTTGGKRKVNKSLKAWVTFVKKVQKEEKLSYKDAIHRAKIRKDKGEKWMSGGEGTSTGTFVTIPLTDSDPDLLGVVGQQLAAPPASGGKRRRRSRTVRKSHKGGRRSRRRASRRH